ncbi:MAG: TolC family protein, partial [Pseudomonadota bacterium]
EGRTPGPAGGIGSTGVTNFSVGHERSTWRYNLELRWSPTDAALAYYLWKSGGNDGYRAHYQRVRVAQKLIGTVESAFFRLLAFQKLLPMAVRLKALQGKVLKETEHLYERNMKSVEDYQMANQGFLRSAGKLLAGQDGFERQRNILATAMQLSPDYHATSGFVVTGDLPTPKFNAGAPQLEMTAVRNRPESYEAGLNHLNSINDVHRTIIKYFPKFSGYWKYTRDKDKFLYNKDWKEVGVRATFDLTDWLTNLDESKAAEANSAKAEREVSAVALGLTSQVREAALRYHRSVGELDNAEASAKISGKVLEKAKLRAGKDDITKLALLQAEASSLMEEIDRIRALGEVNANLAELGAEMGTNYGEPHPAN